MPKRPKHEAKPKTPVKPKRPADPNRAAHALITEHMARLEAEAAPDFQTQLSAHMRKLGAKGGKVSGARRMTNLTPEKRSEIALKAAMAKWKKKRERERR